MNDLTDTGLVRCWIFFLWLLLDSDSCLTLWFWTAIVFRERKWIWRSIYIDLLLVVRWNLNSPECATHWDRVVLFIMDKIALFHFNNLLVVTPVMGFPKHSRMPAFFICISMSRPLSAVAIKGTAISLTWGQSCHRIAYLSCTDICVLSWGRSCWDSDTTYLWCICRSCRVRVDHPPPIS